jgi:DNA repair protein RadC
VDLNRETEGMKFGAVRDGNLLSALMIACDGHDGASSAAPKPRHHFQTPARKYHKYQIDNELRRMMHNHPSGDPTPSTADIRMTLDIIAIAQPFGISVHDHLIVGRNGHASLKGLKFI